MSPRSTLIRFEQKPIKDVGRADVKAIRTARRALLAATTTRKGGEVGVSRLLRRLGHLLSWAIVEGYIDAHPFQRGGVTVVKLPKETARVRRLIDVGEEERLLASASPHLRDLILAALGTGGRLGELLSVCWRDIRTTVTSQGQSLQMIHFRAEVTKTATGRTNPVGTRLAAVLEMRRHDPKGQPFGPDCYVYGTTTGEQIKSIKKSWMTCVLKANGHVPTWTKGGKNQLSVESRAAYASINLHFHDLRREAASRMHESGAPLVVVQAWLRHTSVAQTAKYLAMSSKALAPAVADMEAYEERQSQAHREQQAHGRAVGSPVLSLGSDRIQ